MKKNINKLSKVFVSSTTVIAAAFLPIITSAATVVTTTGDKKDLMYLVRLAIRYFNVAIYLIIALAVVVFVFNIFRYFLLVDTEKKEAAKYVMYSVTGFFIIIAFWGLVNILKNTFELDTNPPPAFSGTNYNNVLNVK